MLEVKNIVKYYGSFVANNSVTITAESGRVFGLLGPNGAGKTTLIRMITNIIEPDSGTIELNGQSITAASQEVIGYLPEERGLYKKLTVIDQLRYFGRLKGLSARDAKQRGLWWLDRLEASSWVNKKVQELSKGMQQKVQFIATVLHEPELVILDEPFSGLDPLNAETLIDVIKELKNRGATVILSTHQMDQVEKLCDDIALIASGTLVLAGSVRDVKAQHRANTILVEYDTDLDLDTIPTHVEVVASQPGRVELRLDPTHINSNDVLRWASVQTVVTKFELSQPSLHEIFISTVTANKKSAA